MPRELIDFDPARHLTSAEARAAFITDMIEEGSPEELAQAIAILARAKGKPEVPSSHSVKASSRVAPDSGDPRISTLSRVLDELGLRLTVAPKEPAASS